MMSDVDTKKMWKTTTEAPTSEMEQSEEKGNKSVEDTEKSGKLS